MTSSLKQTITLDQFSDLVGDVQARRVLSAEQAARRLGVTAKELRSWARDKLVPAQFVGKQWLFQATELLDWLADGQRQLRLQNARKESAARPRVVVTEIDERQAKRYIDSFGNEGAVYYLTGLSFEEAKLAFQEAHKAEFEKLRFAVGSDARARAAIATRLKKEQGIHKDRMRTLTEKVQRELAERGRNRPARRRTN